MAKTEYTTVEVRWRACNCTDFVIEEGIIRALLIMNDPRWASVNTKPCTHWESGVVEIPVAKPKPKKKGKDNG